ncbi:unnamed protein product, partial [marine sediment metagenome]
VLEEIYGDSSQEVEISFYGNYSKIYLLVNGTGCFKYSLMWARPTCNEDKFEENDIQVTAVNVTANHSSKSARLVENDWVENFHYSVRLVDDD